MGFFQDFMSLNTLIFVQFGVTCVSFIALHLLYKINQNDIGIKAWRNGALAAAIGSLSLALFNKLPLPLSVIPGVLGLMMSYVFFWHGSNLLLDRDKHGIKVLWGVFFLSFLMVAPTVYSESYGVGYGIRVIVLSFVTALFCMLSAYSLYSYRHGITTGSFFLVTGFSGTGVFAIARMLVTIFDLETKPKPIDVISFFIYTVLTVMLILGVVILISEKLQNKLKVQASTDPLTGLINRRAFYELVKRVLSQGLRDNSYTTVAMLDLDHFKIVNDEFGHDAGDKVLEHFSAITRQELRSIDLFARFGGEEFVIVLPNTEAKIAEQVLERVRKKLELSPIEIDSQSILITVSIGLYSSRDNSHVEHYLKMADDAVYLAKENGRNRVLRLGIPSHKG